MACPFRPAHAGWMDLHRGGRADVHALPGEVAVVLDVDALDDGSRAVVVAPLMPAEARRLAALLSRAAEMAACDAYPAT